MADNNDTYNFDDLVDSTSVETADSLKQNAFATEDLNPDQEAQVVKLSTKFNTTPEFIRPNVEDFQKKDSQPQFNFDDLVNNTPQTGQWLAKDPSHVAIAKDDIANLQNIEKKTQEYGAIVKSYKALNAGASTALSGVLKFPKLAYDVAAIPVNKVVEKYGYAPVTAEEYFKGKYLETAIKFFDDVAQYESNQIPELNQSIVDEAKKGNFANVGANLYYQTLQSAPNTVTAILSTMAGNPAYGLGSIFISASGSKYEENKRIQKERELAQAGQLDQQTGIPNISIEGGSTPLPNEATTPAELAPAISDNQAILNALGSGAIETITEQMFGAFNGLKKGIKPLLTTLQKEAGVETTKQVMKQFLKTMASSGAEEGFEEVIASGANDFADYMTDVNPDALKMRGFITRMVESGLVGAVSGVGLTSPAALGMAYQQKRALKQAQLNRDTLLALGPEINNSKLKDRLPEKHQEYVKAVTANGPVQNVYVPVEKFDAYFQENNDDPAKAAAQIGISKEYDEAKQTGDLVKIPIEKYAEKITGTQAEKGLIDNTKFSPEDLTVNEANEFKQELSTRIEEVKVEEQTQKTTRSEISQIQEDIRSKLLNSGLYTNDEASSMALTMAESYRVRSDEVYGGQSPLQIYNQEGLKIEALQGIPQGVQVFAQADQLSPEFEKNSQIVNSLNEDFTLEQARDAFKDLTTKEKKALGLDKYFKQLNKSTSTKAEFLNYLQFREALPQADKTKRIKGFFDPVNKFVGLIKGEANLSTFLHEGGHVFLDQIKSDFAYLRSIDAEKLNAKQQAFMERAQTILDYLEVKSFSEIGRDQHEKWARSFEAYLMEGKAPSAKLAKAFEAFKVWFLNIYKSLKGLEITSGQKINLTPEVREVFDRMFVTSEEINRAQENYQELFKDPIAAGMDKTTANNWYKVSSEAVEAANSLALKPTIDDYVKKQQEFYKKEKATVKNELLAKLQLTKGYIALNNLESNKKFKNLPVEVQAEMSGYVSVSEYQDDISRTKMEIDSLDQKAQEIMDLRYGDSYSLQNLEEKAIEAIHNEKKIEKLRIEAEFLANNLNDKKLAERLIARLPSSKIIKEQATRAIAEKNIGDIKPYVFERAERKASKEAAKAFKNIEGKSVEETQKLLQQAFEAKRSEILNHEMFKASIAVRDNVAKTIKDYKKKLFKSNEELSATRNIDFVNAARAVLSNFGITRAEKTAEEYLSKVKRYEPETYAGIMNIVNSALDGAGPISEISYSRFLSMKRSVDALWSLSRSTELQTIEGQKIDRMQVIQEMAAKSAKIRESKRSKEIYERTSEKHGAFKNFGLKLKGALTRVEAFVDYIDGGDINGPWRKFLWQPIVDANIKYDLVKNNLLKDFKSKLQEYGKDLKKEEIIATELINEKGQAFIFSSKFELIMAILHTGNDSNKSKLIRGYGWGTEINGVLDTSNWDRFIARMIQEGVLTKKDFDFIQSVWDLTNTLLPDLQKTHKEIEGYYFEEIANKPFEMTFKDGTKVNYKGGYIPAKVDTGKVRDFQKLEEIDIFEKNNPSYAFPTTGAGATKTRNDQFARQLSLDLNLLGAHIDWSLRYIYFEPRVREVSRLINNQSMKDVLSEVDPEIKNVLESWLQRTAQQRITLPSTNSLMKAIEPVAHYFRTSASMQVMFGNVTNSLQQLTGLLVASAKVKPRYIFQGFVTYLNSYNKKFGNTAVDSMIEKSEYMKSIMGTNIFETQDALNDLIANPSKYEKVQEWAIRHTYILQAATQNIVNTSVWWGAYNEAVTEGMSEKDAIRSADSAVRMTQGTNKAIDIASFEVGTSMQKLFVQFAGYFNMLLNLNAAQAGKVINDIGYKKGAGRLFYIYTMGFMLPAVISETLVMALSGKGFDQDDDDEYLDDLMLAFFGSQFKTATAMVPALGQFAVAKYNKAFTDSVYDDRLNMSLAISTLDQITNFPINLYKDIQKESVDAGRTAKDFLTFLGVVTKTPLGLPSKQLKYLIDVSEGKIEPTGPIDLTRGLITGKGEGIK